MVNASQLFKDDEDERTGNGGDDQLQHTIGTAGSLSKREKGLYNSSSDSQTGSGSPITDRGELRGRESKPAGASPLSGAAANFAVNLADTTPFGRVVSFFKRHKRGSTASSIVGVIILVLGIFGAATITEYELSTIDKVVQKYEQKVEQKAEKKAAKRIVTKIMCRALPTGSAHASSIGCKNKGADDATKAAQDEEPLAKNMDEFKFTDADNVEALKQQGITVETDDSGNFSGLRDDNTGKLITYDQLNAEDSALVERVETALPEWDVGQLEAFRSLMVEDAGASFEVLNDDPKEDGKTQIKEAVLDENGSPEINKTAAENGDEPPENATQAEKDAHAAAESSVDSSNSAVQATEKAIEDGKSGPEAIKAGEDAEAASSAGQAVLVNTVVSEVCSLKKDADKGSKARVKTIMDLLVRHYTTLISVAGQERNGHLTSKSINGVMSILNGDPSAKATKADPYPTASLPFSAAAGWQRVIGKVVNKNKDKPNYTPDVDSSAKPVANAGTQVVQDIDSVVSKTGIGNSLCAAENNAVGGWVIGGILGVAQVAIDGFSLGTAQIAATGGIVAAQQLLQRLVVPEILKYFTPVGVYGLEESAQWINNAIGGGNIAVGDYSKRLGAQPASNAAANKAFALASESETKDEQLKPWTERTFALSNPDSLFARMAVSLPTTRNATIASVASYFSSLPSILSHSFGSLTNLSHASADDAANPGTPYGVTQYLLPPEKYDPIDNEQYLTGTITVQDSKGNSITAKRIDMLGNPNSFPKASADPSTTDALHCYTTGYNQTTTQPNYNDPICATVGNFDYDNDPPKAMTDAANLVPNVYCPYLQSKAPAPIVNCPGQVAPQTKDDIGHFTQYILDSHVATDFHDLANQSGGDGDGSN